MRLLLALPVLSSLLVAQAAPELVVSVGHSGAPTRAAFFGSHLATAAWSNVAIIDLSSGLTISHLPQGSLVEAIEASPAGDLLAVGTCDHAVQLWNTRSVTIVRRLALIQECAESVSFSPDGALLATGAYGCCSADNGLQVWDVHSGKLVRELARGSGIRHVAFSGDGRWVAGVDDKGKTSMFEWPSGRELRAFQGLEMPGYSGSALIAARDGRYLAWIGNGLRVWDVTSGSEVPLPGGRRVDVLSTLPGGPVRQGSGQLVTARVAEFLNDGRLAYVDDDEQMVLTRLPDGPRQVVSLPKAETRFFGDVGIVQQHSWLRIRRDGLLLAGSRGSRTIVWDSATDRIRELTAPALPFPTSLEWSGSGIVAWTGLGSGVQGWNDGLGKPADFNSVEAGTSLAFRPDGARLAVSGSTAIHVIDIASRRAVASRDLPPAAGRGVAFSPDGSRLAFASSPAALGVFDGNLRLQRLIGSLEAHTSAEHVAFSQDGRWIAAGLVGAHPTLRVWPADGSGGPVTLDAGSVTYGPQPPAFSGDSRRLASFKRGNSLMIWSTTSWNVERTLALSGTGRALAFAPNGSRLAVASDGEAAIWDPHAGRKLVSFSTPGSAETKEIAWSPDGRRVVTAADDGVLRFWNSSDGQLLASLYMLDDSGDWLLATPDGRLDGSKRALADLVAWRVAARVVPDRRLTQEHRVRGLWRSLSMTPRRP